MSVCFFSPACPHTFACPGSARHPHARPAAVHHSEQGGWTSNVIYWASSSSFLTLFLRLSCHPKDAPFPSHFWMPPADPFLSPLDGRAIFTPSALFWIQCLRLQRPLLVDEGASESTCSSASQERVVLPRVRGRPVVLSSRVQVWLCVLNHSVLSSSL